MAIIDLTLEMERRQKNPNPCDSCERSHHSISQWTDPQTGHLMQRSEDCSETCELFKKEGLTIIGNGDKVK